ncbi:hypothetical protein R5R35_005016 [Gryllus longicercus]|uniref:Receptor-binding cancer antigen expressed on SiSo cells n=1 Tax=Gryllus longicercus TaxID=2509291 RepID=A0AAN9Z628_9ORTH|nr:Receptor-binding cancer antigen expressed on SiSo cells [Gryllus bimaculatus]
MAVTFVLNRLKALFFIVVDIFKRALCCFRRRRRNSGEPVPLTDVGIIPNKETHGLQEISSGDLQSWNSWDTTPSCVVTEHSPKDIIQQKIEMYRQKTTQVTTEEETEPQPDFFQDMTPRITKQPKIILKSDADGPSWSDTISTRLSADGVPLPGPELETWEDTPGWEDQTQDEWDPDTILKEKRQLERQRRLADQQRKKMEREKTRMGRPVTLGSRLS